jgi:uncharacterized membrane-anchored protein YitT (DUF2179 family)
MPAGVLYYTQPWLFYQGTIPRSHPIQEIHSCFKEKVFSRKTVRDYGLILAGALIQALAMHMFLVPSKLVCGGISGTAQIINYFSDWPISLMILMVMHEMERGITILPGTGGYTGSSRPVLYCVVARAKAHQLKVLVSEADP